jgi:hypothetical protein
VFQISVNAPPFVGVFDASGSDATSVLLPAGLTGVVVYGISHTVTAGLVSGRSNVASVVVL